MKHWKSKFFGMTVSAALICFSAPVAGAEQSAAQTRGMAPGQGQVQPDQMPNSDLQARGETVNNALQQARQAYEQGNRQLAVDQLYRASLVLRAELTEALKEDIQRLERVGQEGRQQQTQPRSDAQQASQRNQQVTNHLNNAREALRQQQPERLAQALYQAQDSLRQQARGVEGEQREQLRQASGQLQELADRARAGQIQSPEVFQQKLAEVQRMIQSQTDRQARQPRDGQVPNKIQQDSQRQMRTAVEPDAGQETTATIQEASPNRDVDEEARLIPEQVRLQVRESVMQSLRRFTQNDRGQSMQHLREAAAMLERAERGVPEEARSTVRDAQDELIELGNQLQVNEVGDAEEFLSSVNDAFDELGIQTLKVEELQTTPDSAQPLQEQTRNQVTENVMLSMRNVQQNRPRQAIRQLESAIATLGEAQTQAREEHVSTIRDARDELVELRDQIRADEAGTIEEMLSSVNDAFDELGIATIQEDMLGDATLEGRQLAQGAQEEIDQQAAYWNRSRYMRLDRSAVQQRELEGRKEELRQTIQEIEQLAQSIEQGEQVESSQFDEVYKEVYRSMALRNYEAAENLIERRRSGDLGEMNESQWNERLRYRVNGAMADFERWSEVAGQEIQEGTRNSMNALRDWGSRAADETGEAVDWVGGELAEFGNTLQENFGDEENR